MSEEASESSAAGFSKENQVATDQTYQLHHMKQQVNRQSDKIEGAQKEIEMMRDVLSDARRRLERMKEGKAKN